MPAYLLFATHAIVYSVFSAVFSLERRTVHVAGRCPELSLFLSITFPSPYSSSVQHSQITPLILILTLSISHCTFQLTIGQAVVHTILLACMASLKPERMKNRAGQVLNGPSCTHCSATFLEPLSIVPVFNSNQSSQLCKQFLVFTSKVASNICICLISTFPGSTLYTCPLPISLVHLCFLFNRGVLPSSTLPMVPATCNPPVLAQQSKQQ